MVTRPEESLTEIFQKYLLLENSPPLYYILMHFWQLAAIGRCGYRDYISTF
jgi:hypothetical protein